MEEKTEQIIQQIKHYQKKIQDMDNRVNLFLSDRSKYPNPFYQDLVAEIRRFEANLKQYDRRQTAIWLENLLNSILTYEKLWRSAFERDEERYRRSLAAKA